MTQALSHADLPTDLNAEAFPIKVPEDDPLYLRVGDLRLVKEALAEEAPCQLLLGSDPPLCRLALDIDEEFRQAQKDYLTNVTKAVQADMDYLERLRILPFRDNNMRYLITSIWGRYYQEVMGSLRRRQWVGDVIVLETKRLNRIRGMLEERLRVVARDLEDNPSPFDDDNLPREREQLNRIFLQLFPGPSQSV